MAGKTVVKLTGLDEFRRSIFALPNKLRKKALMKPLREAAKVVLKTARQLVPTISKATKRRNVGTVKKRIVVRASKSARANGDVGVFVGVKPLTKDQISNFKQGAARRGARWSGSFNPNDPYYWSWLEFGHKKVARDLGQKGGGVTAAYQRLRNGRLVLRKHRWQASSIVGRRRMAGDRVAPRPFMTPASKQLANALTVFQQEAVKAINALNENK